MSGERCTRKRIDIDGENFYIVVGDSFVQATIPEENFSKNKRVREVVELLCEGITGVMEERNEANS